MQVRQIIPRDVVMYCSDSGEEIRHVGTTLEYRSGPGDQWVEIKASIPKEKCAIPVKPRTPAKVKDHVPLKGTKDPNKAKGKYIIQKSKSGKSEFTEESDPDLAGNAKVLEADPEEDAEDGINEKKGGFQVSRVNI